MEGDEIYMFNPRPYTANKGIIRASRASYLLSRAVMGTGRQQTECYQRANIYKRPPVAAQSRPQEKSVKDK